MALESGTYINSLNASNPASTDGLGQADDHLRLIKSTIKATFPNLDGAVTASVADLNSTSSIPSALTDLGISDGSSGQFLTTDGSGNFSFASVTQGSSGIALTDLSIGAENAASGNGAISYNNSTGVFQYTPPTATGIGALTAHPSTSPQAASSSDNTGQTFIQDISVDSFGHITAIGTATASATVPTTAAAVGTYSFGRPPNRNTTYAAGATATDFHSVQMKGPSGIPRYTSSGFENANSSLQSGTWRSMSGSISDGGAGYCGIWVRTA